MKDLTSSYSTSNADVSLNAIYSKTTEDIEITVQPVYLEDQSVPDERHYVWAYHVRIKNNRSDVIQLRSRYWKITDSLGFSQEVQGEGVVGEQPLINASETFEYSSGTPLNTPSGIMMGHYTMKNDAGIYINVEIPAFSLDSPHDIQVIH